MNVVAIIQARMGSERFPGKILVDISGKPMLWHVVDRTRRSNLINKVVVATTEELKDDVVEDFCKNSSIDVYRGSENDVLNRYYQAADVYKADAIVRITGDCPLIDPHTVNKVINDYLSNMNGYAGASNVIKRTYPRGLDTEIFLYSSLKKMHSLAKEAKHREHVTMYMHEHQELFKLFSVVNSKDLSHLRWTVDEEADMRFVTEIYKRLYNEKDMFLAEDVIASLKEEPQLMDINKDIRQKI